MKKPKKVFNGIIKDKKLELDNRQGLIDYIKILQGGKKEQKVSLTIERYIKKRSNPQNDYYQGVVLKILANELGYTRDEMHEAIKWEFLRKRGKKIDTVISTKKLNTIEFEDLMERIRRWSSEYLNVYIPNPNEVDYE